jgi:hypothetical protein
MRRSRIGLPSVIGELGRRGTRAPGPGTLPPATMGMTFVGMGV